MLCLSASAIYRTSADIFIMILRKSGLKMLGSWRVAWTMWNRW